MATTDLILHSNDYIMVTTDPKITQNRHINANVVKVRLPTIDL